MFAKAGSLRDQILMDYFSYNNFYYNYWFVPIGIK